MANLVFHTYDGFTNVRSDQVLFFEADDHYCNIVYYSGYSFMLPFGLGMVEGMLKEGNNEENNNFLRLGRKYIVNIDYVHQVNTVTQTLTFINATASKVSIKLPKMVLRELMEILEKRVN